MNLADLPPEKPNALVRKYAAAVRAMAGIDPAIIGDELGIQPRTVMMVQRKIGLRRCVPASRVHRDD